MKVSIFSLKKILYQGEAESLNCNTQAGEITVLDNHIPLISMLKTGLIKVVEKNRGLKYVQVESGFLEVRSNSEVRCIVEEART